MFAKNYYLHKILIKMVFVCNHIQIGTLRLFCDECYNILRIFKQKLCCTKLYDYYYKLHSIP